MHFGIEVRMKFEDGYEEGFEVRCMLAGEKIPSEGVR